MVGTAALIFARPSVPSSQPVTQSVWFYDLTADGFSLDDKRTPVEANDIPDMLAKWPSREEGSNSYRVEVDRIQQNDWSLAAGRYKPVTIESVHHDVPAEILREILKLEEGIIQHCRGLAKNISEKK